MTAPEIMLKAARLAHPGKKTGIDTDFKVYVYHLVGRPELFNPHDPTKGDLAALNEALEREWWRFEFEPSLENFWAIHKPTQIKVNAPTPAERAIKCVEAM